MDQIVAILFYVGAVQGLLLSVFLFSVKVNKISSRLLGLLTLLWGLLLIQFPLQSEGLYTRFPHLLKTLSQLLFTIFPLLYLQVKYLISDQKRFRKSDLLHFIPMLLSILFHSNFYLLSGPEKVDAIRNMSSYFSAVQIIGDEILAIQGIVYSILAIRMLLKYKKEIENYQSNIDKKILKVELIGISLSMLSWIIGTIGVNLEFFDVPVFVDLFVLVYFIFVVIIYIVSYFALTSPEIFKIDEDKINLLVNTRSKNKSIEGQYSSDQKVPAVNSKALPEEIEITPELKANNQRLLTFMDSEKPYLDSNLGLHELADKLEITRHQLSNVINQVHKKNFYEFVNSYRVEEVKHLLQDPESSKFKLISLAYDAGFNSKTSFNRIFKQMTTMTPSQFFSMHQAV